MAMTGEPARWPAVGSGPRRVLVVDDSVVARQVVARAVKEDAALELAGVAADGRIALEKVAAVRPDVVVLDLEMPVMDGFETLAAMRASYPDLPVIVYSQFTTAGAAATLDALALGASGFVCKPSAAGGDQESVRSELLPLLKAVTAAPVLNSPMGRPARPPAWSPVSAVVVATSTGGPNALVAVVGALPANLRVPVLIVQHMPAMFVSLLVERLARLTPLPVHEAVAGQEVVPGSVYVAPGGRHMGIERRADKTFIALYDSPPENSCRPAADVLFRSAANVYGARVLGVVLTGMGRDGLRGAETITAAGGSVIVESQATAVVWSMPGAVAEAGLASAVVPIDQIASEIDHRVRGGS